MSTHVASIPERLVYGRPEDPDIDPPIIHVARRPGTAFVGRLLLAGIFLVSGIAKLTDPEAAIAHMAAQGIQGADILVWVAGIAEVTGAAALIFGAFTRLAAMGLVLFLIPTTIIFHDFWMLTGQEQVMQMANFLKNVAIAGGLAAIVAYGAGRYSLDYLVRRPIEP
jgi:putative oxidoreductase